MSADSSLPKQEAWSPRVVETAIRLSLLAVIIVWCFQILQPFILPFIWATIIAVAIHPLFDSLVRVLGGRSVLAAVLVTVVVLLVLMVPTIMLTKLLIENVAELADGIRQGRIEPPALPDSVREWPLIGDPVARFWDLALSNLTEAIHMIQPQLKAVGLWLVDFAASAGIGLLMFLVAIVIAGFLLAHSAQGHDFAHRVARRLAGEYGDRFAVLAGATIRSVARGVLGVAVIQALLVGVGFMAAGVPGAGIWALLSLISAVVQLGVGPVAIPVIVYVFATADPVIAVVFLIWNALIMVLDNILKPLLLGRGVDVPMLVIFLGAIGGMLLSGIIGLFIGAILLALGYKLAQAWLEGDSERLLAASDDR